MSHDQSTVCVERDRCSWKKEREGDKERERRREREVEREGEREWDRQTGQLQAATSSVCLGGD